jgi:hypothetical protein
MPAWFPKPQEKLCSRCKQLKIRAEDFPVEKRRRDSVGPWCYQCLNEQRRKKYWSNLAASRAAGAARWRICRAQRKAELEPLNQCSSEIPNLQTRGLHEAPLG